MVEFLGRKCLKREYELWSTTKRFQTLLEDFCEQMQKAGFNSLVPYNTNSISSFQSKTITEQEGIISSFLKYYELCTRCIASNIDIKDSRKLLWKILPQLGLHPTSELFDRLDDSQVIEVYWPNFVQVFRNMKFLELCSYPVADLYIKPWPELFHRPQEASDEIVRSINSCLTSGETTPCEVKDHFLYEINSPMRQKVLTCPG